MGTRPLHGLARQSDRREWSSRARTSILQVRVGRASTYDHEMAKVRQAQQFMCGNEAGTMDQSIGYWGRWKARSVRRGWTMI